MFLFINFIITLIKDTKHITMALAVSATADIYKSYRWMLDFAYKL